MPDIIQLLPDSTANLIAAGEVVQRPASVVKELMENSIDAGASHIIVQIQGGGQQLIQVIDNGAGMSDTDARLCWERHATSKIRRPDDLFNLHTFGFRGEALASIAAVSQVQMRTRLQSESLGSEIIIEASRVIAQEATTCPIGTTIAVKNLFFNIPARRNFMKSVAIETKHIIEEFERLAMAYPSVGMELIINESPQLNLPSTTLPLRIHEILDTQGPEELIEIHEQAGFVNIHGFVGKPELAKRTRGNQYFFANGRFIREPYFHHAIMSAFEGLLTEDQFPTYVIFLEVKPERLDVNVHPSKTEVKFEDAKDIYPIIRSVLRKALAGLHIEKEINDGAYHPISQNSEQPVFPKSPEIKVNTSFNPFGESYKSGRNQSSWEKLYEPFKEQMVESDVQPNIALPESGTIPDVKFISFNHTYLIAEWQDSLYIVHQQYAHERVLYDTYKQLVWHKNVPSQQLLFPRSIRLNHADSGVMLTILPELNRLGFDISHFGANDFIVNGIPPDLNKVDIQQVIERMLSEFLSNEQNLSLEVREKLLRSMARNSAISAGKALSHETAKELLGKLFQSSEPAFTPFGKPVFVKFAPTSIENLFKS